MVQLTLLSTEPGAPGLAEVVRLLDARASRRFGDNPHVAEASAITRRHFGAWSGRSLDEREQGRVRAYYQAVLRRRLMAGSDADARRGRQALLLATVRADLKEAGWDDARAEREARRVAGCAVAG